jgi:hypothetical protein
VTSISVFQPRTVEVTGPTITECSICLKGSGMSATTGRRFVHFGQPDLAPQDPPNPARSAELGAIDRDRCLRFRHAIHNISQWYCSRMRLAASDRQDEALPIRARPASNLTPFAGSVQGVRCGGDALIQVGVRRR